MCKNYFILIYFKFVLEIRADQKKAGIKSAFSSI